MSCVAQAAETRIFSDDFEAGEPDTMAPRWEIRGPAKDRVPANFTLSMDGPHGGRSSMRIHHPAGTLGDLVLSPSHAISVREGMAYEVTFWTRAQRQGTAMFTLSIASGSRAYQAIASGGYNQFPVGTEWKQHRFEFFESWDLSAAQDPQFILSFRPASDNAEENTLWLDDVTVTERPSSRGRFIPPQALDARPLLHRLEPGPELAIRLDASRPSRPAVREVAGVSFHRLCSWPRFPYGEDGDYTLPPAAETAIRELRLPMTRFYAIGDEKFSLEEAIDRAAEMCRKAGIPTAATSLELEQQTCRSTLPPEVWARGVRYARQHRYGFRYWEISNEPYMDDDRETFPTPEAYLAHFMEVSRVIRDADKDARIGLPIHHSRASWGAYLMREAAGHYDFIVPHYYSFAWPHRHKFEDVVLTANYEILTEILDTEALMKAYNPGRDVFQYDTEWGNHGFGPNGERPHTVRRNGNIFGMLHRAVRLIYYAREEIVRGASSWVMMGRTNSPGFGLVLADQPDRPSMHYWLYYFFNRHLGDRVLEITGTAPQHEGRIGNDTFRGPLTPALATTGSDGRKICLVIVNGSWDNAIPCRVDLTGFAPSKATAMALTHDDPDADPMLKTRDDLVRDVPVQMEYKKILCALPAHSVSFLTIETK